MRPVYRSTLFFAGLAILAYVVVLAFSIPRIQASRPLEREHTIRGSDPERGRSLVESYGCGACHVVPGVPGANSLVGPPLTAYAQRSYIAGNLPNIPENLMRWIRYPQQVEPGTAMPNLNVTDTDARDIAAYLYTLEGPGWQKLPFLQR